MGVVVPDVVRVRVCVGVGVCEAVAVSSGGRVGTSRSVAWGTAARLDFDAAASGRCCCAVRFTAGPKSSPAYITGAPQT